MIPDGAVTNRYEHRVGFHETDAMGIVHHSNYLKYCENSRVIWLETHDKSYSDWMELGLHFAVTRVELDYKQSACFDDIICVTTWLEWARLSPWRMRSTATRRCFSRAAPNMLRSMVTARSAAFRAKIEIACASYACPNIAVRLARNERSSYSPAQLRSSSHLTGSSNLQLAASFRARTNSSCSESLRARRLGPTNECGPHRDAHDSKAATSMRRL